MRSLGSFSFLDKNCITKQQAKNSIDNDGSSQQIDVGFVMEI